jgi:gliding motility-associated lipoprotein GldD
MNKYIIYIISSILIIGGCNNNESSATPKPRMYPRIFYPAKGIQAYIDANCPFTFKHGSYYTVMPDAKPCWFDLHSKDLNATIHCSYYSPVNDKELSKLIDDAFKITSNHNAKASYRNEEVIKNRNGVKGLIFNIDGPVASPLQFYLTDEKNHFFRGSLYFNSKVNADSTLAVLQYLRPEIDSLVASFNWK